MKNRWAKKYSTGSIFGLCVLLWGGTTLAQVDFFENYKSNVERIVQNFPAKDLVQIEIHLDKKVYQEGVVISGILLIKNVSDRYELKLSPPCNSFYVSTLSILIEKNISNDPQKPKWIKAAQIADFNRGNRTNPVRQYQGLPLGIKKGGTWENSLALNMAFVEMENTPVYAVPVFLESGDYRAVVSYLNFEDRFSYAERFDSEIESMKADICSIPFDSPVSIPPVYFKVEKSSMETPRDVRQLGALVSEVSKDKNGKPFFLERENGIRFFSSFEKAEKSGISSPFACLITAQDHINRHQGHPLLDNAHEDLAPMLKGDFGSYLSDLAKILEVKMYENRGDIAQVQKTLQKLDSPDALLLRHRLEKNLK